MKYYILYNPKAGNGRGKEEADLLEVTYTNAVFLDITELTDYAAFFTGLQKDDVVILCGGDGTLNRFANDTDGLTIENRVLYYAVGSGNDFARDMEKTYRDGPFDISNCLHDLPSVWVNGERRRFINGVGFGIDGYCCEEGDRLRAKSDKPVNYPMLAVKGLLWAFKPRSAVVTVDGVRHFYERVWLAPTMKGRYYGGGMKMAPQQMRTDSNDSVSLVVIHSVGKFRLLPVFQSIFTGEHVLEHDMVTVHTGENIMVEFNRPIPLQIDGETVPDVLSYVVQTAGWRRKRVQK